MATAADGIYVAFGPFHKDPDTVITVERFMGYIKRAKMIFSTEDLNDDQKKKAFLQIWGEVCSNIKGS